MQPLDIYLNQKSEGYFAQKRPEMLRFVPESAKRILDAGCGEGWFGEQLKTRQQAEVWGCELDPIAAKTAATRLDTIVSGDLSDTVHTLPEAHFDCIVLNDVLEHLVDPFELLRMLKAKLTDQGCIVCSIPNVRFWGVLKDLLWHKQWRYQKGFVLDKTHLRFFTSKSIVDIMQAIGYDVMTLQGINPIASWKLACLNIVVFGALSDAKYLQFACVAKPKSKV
jgi:2-polyprenyl-3-methyl-5-hydroxy-6-metoxy-1,4-benzoquinol methylase